jgi:hypothetical protein
LGQAPFLCPANRTSLEETHPLGLNVHYIQDKLLGCKSDKAASAA